MVAVEVTVVTEVDVLASKLSDERTPPKLGSGEYLKKLNPSCGCFTGSTSNSWSAFKKKLRRLKN